MVDIEVGSLLDGLRQVPDPRSRRGRSYPLWALLAMLILGALHGERSLRGMWMWGVKHWAPLYRWLGLLGTPRPPAYSTVWVVMSRLDTGAVEDMLTRWVSRWAPVEALSVDAKTLRGSERHRGEQAALEVVTAAGHGLRVVWGQTVVGAESELAATVRLLGRLPLAGCVVTADAGLLHRALAKTVLAQGGDYVGLLKGNEPLVQGAVDEWLDAQLSPPGADTSRG